jgi:hypothetical protein
LATVPVALVIVQDIMMLVVMVTMVTRRRRMMRRAASSLPRACERRNSQGSGMERMRRWPGKAVRGSRHAADRTSSDQLACERGME